MKKRIFMRGKVFGYLCFFSMFSVVFLGCSKNNKGFVAEKKSEQIILIQKTLKQQEEILKRLQLLISDQILRNDELEQVIPPRDLLESLQNGFVELKNKSLALEKQVSLIQKDLEKILKEKHGSPNYEKNELEDQRQIILGLISLQAGNPGQAKGYLSKVLKEKKPTKLKGDILMGIGHSFLAQGHPKQAAAHYGIFLREFPKSSQVPQALYFLGQAMENLGEKTKKRVLWNDLIKKFPKSNFSELARKKLSTQKKSNK